MSPHDNVRQPETRRAKSTNDVHSPDFISLMDERFKSSVRSKQVGFRSYQIDGEKAFVNAGRSLSTTG
jgi:hypothetical protein